MKLFLALFFLAQFSFALSYKSAPSDLYPYMDIHEISQKLKTNQLLEMDLKKKGNIFNNSFDQLYFNPQNQNQFAILKLDIRLDSDQKILKLSNTEFVCHGQTQRDRYFSVYMKGYQFSEFQKICTGLNKKTVFSFKKYLLANVVTTAQAQVDCPDENKNLNDISLVTTKLTDSVLAQKISTCAIDAVRSALKTYKGAVDGVVSILTNPFELWDQISQQAIALKDFVLNLKSEVMGLYSAMKNVDTELIWTIGCQLAGELLAGASLSALGGAGIVKLTQKLVQIFSRLKESRTLIARLSQLSKKGKTETAQGILSCVIK